MEADARREQVHAAIAFVIMAALFAVVGRWGTPANIDVIATDVPAWTLATRGSLEVTGLEETIPWIVPDRKGRMVSNRPPGLIAVAVPSYLLLGRGEFTNGPGTLVALASTLGSMVIMLVVLRSLLPPSFSLGVVLVMALGTTTWTVSAAQLWPHGPGQLMSALALLALSRSRRVAAGIAFAGWILMRPIGAIAAAVTGITESLKSRDLRPVVEIGASSALGVVLLVAYNYLVFGELSINGGYSDMFTSGALDRFGFGPYVANLFQMFVGWPNGLLLFTPVIGAAVIGVALSWRSIPNWARSAALAGLAYLLVHAAVNRASGGMPAFYRYPLEPLMLAAPALALGAWHLWSAGGRAKRILLYSAAFSVGLQFLNAFFLNCRSATSSLIACAWLG